MELAYRRIRPDEVEAAYRILQQCGQDMKARLGLGHWDPPYPLHLWRKVVQDREVYVVLSNGECVATFTLGTEEPAYYHTVPGVWDAWDPAGVTAMYVNRLAVLPEFQGQGIGTWCMHEAESIAFQKKCASVRLDAYDKHQKLVAWYQHLGYQWRGAFAFQTKTYGETGMVCLEKKLACL